MKYDKLPFIDGVVFLILGLVVYFNPDRIISFIAYFIGGLLVGIGIYKSASYYVQNKKNGVVNTNELYFGITAIILGLVIILLSSVMELIFKLLIGGWMICAGLIKVYNTFNTTDRSSKFYALLITGIVLVGAGLYTILVSNLGVKIIGLFMSIYGVVQVVSFFMYRTIDTKPIIKEAEIEEK